MATKKIIKKTTGEKKDNLKLEPYQVVIRPIITEKGLFLAEHRNTYSFVVNRLADKGVIKKAVEDLFNVKVVSVHVQNRAGKTLRYRRELGRTSAWKKAIVKLHPESKISYF
ncbi:MAG: 50S ribosomal protein L23 [Planctomycetaceae bacterium]|jgi:large subunit ribosomal protein L23|nr:50S ribosomal protein L23 [Planctomycetaceae bacterium]